VGLQGSSVSETALNKTGLKMSQKSYENLNAAFKGLEAGEVDFVLCEAYPGAYLASLHDGLAFAGALNEPKVSGVAIKSANKDLADATKAAFEVVSANGQLQDIRERWVGSMPVLTKDSQIKDIPEGETKDEDESDEEAEDGESKEEGGATETVTEEGSTDAGSNAITSIPG
jgi:polar amino acid transport system substrate-binding protein